MRRQDAEMRRMAWDFIFRAVQREDGEGEGEREVAGGGVRCGSSGGGEGLE